MAYNSQRDTFLDYIVTFEFFFLFPLGGECSGFVWVAVTLLLIIPIELHCILPNSCMMLFPMQEIEAEMARTQK